jgi:hypothetical protein
MYFYKFFTIMIFDLNEIIKSFIRYGEFNDYDYRVIVP